MEGATCGLGFWHALKVRAWEPFHMDMVHFTCSWWCLAEDRAWVWDLVTRAPSNFCSAGKKRNGSWTFDPNPMAINRTLSLFFGEIWKFSQALTLNNTKFPEFKPAPELNKINSLIPQETWEFPGFPSKPCLAMVVLKTYSRAWSMFTAGWSVSGFQRLFPSGFREEDEQGMNVKQAELW